MELLRNERNLFRRSARVRSASDYLKSNIRTMQECGAELREHIKIEEEQVRSGGVVT